ncbi:hypothetical protein FKW77_009318 [Venturia effusa]|uniref:Uncharacterized protein n=1 Tax=Venturia effusa TaxID=50376 RepID=A0A517L437_9PEZI|nr:hypothetical protein FKW77_009318 [Venturia effusa]
MRPEPRNRTPTAKAAEIATQASRPTPQNRNPAVEVTTVTADPRPTTRGRDITAEAAIDATPRPMIRTSSSQAPRILGRQKFKNDRKLTTTTTSRLVSPSITPLRAHDSAGTPSLRFSKMTGEEPDADVLPLWLLKTRPLPTLALPGLSTPLTVPIKTYTEKILRLPQPIRHRIFDLIFDLENQTTLSTFGNWQEWKAPAILRLNRNFLEDALPVFLRRTTLVIHRGEEFSVAKVLSNGPARSAVTKLDFPRAYLNSRDDLRVFEIMQACPSLRELTLDICVDHLLRPKLDKQGNQVSWEPMPLLQINKRYSLALVARVPNLAVLRYRLVGGCYGWKRQFVQPVIDDIAALLLKFTSGHLVLQSLGWWGWKETGWGSRIPTVRGDGLVLARDTPDIMDCSA